MNNKVTVTRCQDCTCWGMKVAEESEKFKVCTKNRIMMIYKGYCSLAEPKEKKVRRK